MWIQTYTGKKFDLSDPQPDMICIEDIAHGLSNICRFTGQCEAFYSVAQHSVQVSCHLPTHLKFQGLMHDATEAYIGDVSWPLKQMLPEYRRIEERVWSAIAAKFNLPLTLDPAVKEVDGLMLMAERQSLMKSPPEPWEPQFEALARAARHIPITAWSPSVASLSFISLFDFHTNKPQEKFA